MIPYGHQDVRESDIEAVVRVLRSDFLTQGPIVPQFEEAIAKLVGARHAVAVSSATAALHVACLALHVGPGDWLWTTANTFVASANCGRYCGAEVDFVDIDARTWNMSVPKLREKLVQARSLGRLPKVVVPVHFAGQPTEQEEIRALAYEFGFKIVEDASHAIGASRNGEPVGSCRWSEVTVFSFHPVKIITSGEGGVALTNDSQLAERMAKLRSHGITRDPQHLLLDSDASPSRDGSKGGQPPWYYEQQLLGYNYRMSDIHAALGLSQLSRVRDYIERRNEFARRYDEALKHFPLQLPCVAAENRSAFHLYVVRLKSQVELKAKHRQVIDYLHRCGIRANLHYIPVHLHPYYRALGFGLGQFPEAEAYSQSAVTLPLFPSMTTEAQDVVITALEEIL
ncbi:MAG: UDP-4-amino-4,6-dideoxy-N-acetyl-beta-L-altrosamine transaminase [Ktedonobacteraceae bacterium]